MNRKDIKSLLNEKKEILLVIAPLLLGLYLRAQTLKWHRIFAYDPYFYYRQAVYFANGGHIHDIDPMIVTTIRRFSDNEYFLPLLWAYLGKISHVDLWTLGIYLPLVIFVAQIIVVYKIGKDAFNWKVGFFAALFLSVMGAHVYRTHAGGIWKDTLGSLFMLMFLHSVILIIKEKTLGRKKVLVYGGYLALSLYLSIITFDGFGEFSLAVSTYLVLSPLIVRPRKNEFLIAILIVPVLLLGGVSVGTYWPWSKYPLKEIYLFVPFLIASVLATISLTLGFFLPKVIRTKKKQKIGYILILLAEVVGGLYLSLKWEPISRFVYYLLNPNMAGLSAQSNSATFGLLWSFFASLLIFAFFGSIANVRIILKSSKNTMKKMSMLFLILFAIGSFLGIATIRLMYLMSFGVAFLSATSLDQLNNILKAKALNRNTMAIALTTILLFAIVPPFIESEHYISMTPIPNDEWLNAVKWMGKNLPNETVFNWWDWGHWIQAFGVRTTSDNIYQRGNEYAWFVRTNENNSLKFIKKIQDIAKRNTGSNITTNYVIISQDLMFKFDTLNRYYPEDKQIAVYVLRLTGFVGDVRIYSAANSKVQVIVELGKNSTRAILAYDSVQRELKNIVVEIPSRQNLIYNPSYVQDSYIVYVTPYVCFLIPSNLKDTMLVRLLVFEQSGKYTLMYDNGYVKVYKVKN
ncbi:hypothetical protein [Thermococcus barossii]|uniref:dolichyl-phosphooligosaccharide-protein glycotransferase n=1 Tax=Thermococcus barossii TaxID=54077 RepID=A0A2Z2MJ28_9EURY|nr:hypothetical protein [Thermococcus barossii]ASJ05733.1 hypothetical protein A3L01_10285 [Thermococcus barossii]